MMRAAKALAVLPLLISAAAMGLDGSEHGFPSAETAIVTALLTVTPPVRTRTGTQHPDGVFAGTTKLIWSTPAQQLLRPLYCTVAAWPPTKTSTCVGKFPVGGVPASELLIGPSPLAHIVITWPGFAAVTRLFTRWGL